MKYFSRFRLAALSAAVLLCSVVSGRANTVEYVGLVTDDTPPFNNSFEMKVSDSFASNTQINDGKAIHILDQPVTTDLTGLCLDCIQNVQERTTDRSKEIITPRNAIIKRP